jgi:hypothetical protein
MKVVQVLKNQSLFDLSIQSYGSIEAVIDMALENDLSVTDELETGAEINMPELSIARLAIVRYYEKNKIKPATEVTAEKYTDIVPDDGCNYCKLFE